jgi:hypothetical protein
MKTKMTSFAAALLIATMATAESLDGAIGSATGPGPADDPLYQSSWLDLSEPTNFARGDTLKLTLSGSARTVVVRLLRAGESSDQPNGIEGGERTIPEGGVLEVTLSKSYANVTHVSVHAGRTAWTRKLRAYNAPVKLESVERNPARP